MSKLEYIRKSTIKSKDTLYLFVLALFLSNLNRRYLGTPKYPSSLYHIFLPME